MKVIANKRNLNVADLIVLSFPYVLFLTIAIICINNCFFQDMVQLSSSHASWYYDNNFSHFLLPNEIDSGHPPLNGMLLASLWKIFGRSLWVGHLFWSLAAFVMIYQAQKLCKRLFSNEVANYVALVVLTDATLLTQSVLVSPDIILMAFFFTAIRSIFENRKTSLTIAILFLSFISVRGMMCIAALFLVYIYYQHKTNPVTVKRFIKISLPFLPGVAAALAFLGYHYHRLGWIGYHADMPWAPCFQKIESFQEFVKNGIIMVWRFVDFGRLIIWILLFYSIYCLSKRRRVEKTAFTNEQIAIIFLFILMLFISSYSFLLHKSLSGHRYLLPHYAIVTIIAFFLLSKSCSAKKMRNLAILASFVLLSGHFIKYPEKISTGWDATLSHISFYSLRTQMFNYIEENQIPTDNISSGFGLHGPQNTIDLISPKNLVIKNIDCFEKTDYFIYSNVSNLDDTIIDKLKNREKYKLIQNFEKGNVFISLYKKQ
jgi:4-amino-4-deoxy-L-arabinose transferase-like glycosyltransferase